MSVRVTATEVKAILEDTALTDLAVDAYIVSANAMVNEIMATTDTSDLLKELERWLTAHMIAISKERQTIKEEAGTAKATYANIYGQGLKATSYGQMVLSLDTSGAFARTLLKPISMTAISQFES